MPQSERNASIESLINEHVQKLEYEMMASNDWNLHSGTGSEILEAILKFSNEKYDFERILSLATFSSMARIFLTSDGQ